MFDLFKILESIHINGSNVAIQWYYEEDDDEILEMGNDYSSVIELPFTFIEVEE